MVKKVAVPLILLSALVWADTLDFARQEIVVTNLLHPDRPKQKTAVSLDAKALEVLKQASYDRGRTVADFLLANPKQRQRLERMRLDNHRADTRYLSDGTISTDYVFPIAGDIIEQILPAPDEPRLLGKLACPCCGQAWPEDRVPPEGVELVPLDDENTPEWTGILVDVRGLDFEPALFPMVVTEQDEEVYGPSFTDEEQLAGSGMFGYYTSQSKAVLTDRIGSNPLVVRALAVTGSNSCDPIISGYDAGRMHASTANLDLMAECRVGFLVD
jgi:hypothetical protein